MPPFFHNLNPDKADWPGITESPRGAIVHLYLPCCLRSDYLRGTNIVESTQGYVYKFPWWTQLCLSAIGGCIQLHIWVWFMWYVYDKGWSLLKGTGTANRESDFNLWQSQSTLCVIVCPYSSIWCRAWWTLYIGKLVPYYEWCHEPPISNVFMTFSITWSCGF